MNRTALVTLWGLSMVVGAAAQVAAPTQTPRPSSVAPISAPSSAPNTMLAQLEQTMLDANSNLGRLRIEKWKADSANKQQWQHDSDSIQRNITAAMPGMIAQVRSNPSDIAANFTLYRNLIALYDVFSSLTESAGAFGSKNDFEALAADANNLDRVRRNLGDRIEMLAANTQSELTRLRAAAAAARTQAASTPAKKVIIDDNATPKKVVKKKKKPATASSAKPASAASTTSTSP